MFYLSAGPEQFEPIITRLKKAGLNEPGAEGGWSRAVIEKPFGTDLAGARHLNGVVSSAFPESNTYRIDHFLGKETAQNIMVLRFANAIFEPIWNSRYIDHIEITAAETLGVEARAGYYETSGALRDMVQNHLIQLLTMVCMEPPTDLSADSVRDEKVKVLRSLRQFKGDEDVKKNVVRGQYAAGAINGAAVPAYRAEPNVKPQSQTETFVAMRVRHRQLALGGRADLRARGQAAAEVGRGDQRAFQGGAERVVQPAVRGQRERGQQQRARHPHPARRGREPADAEQAARRGVAHRAGEDGFPVRRELSARPARKRTNACCTTR